MKILKNLFRKLTYKGPKYVISWDLGKGGLVYVEKISRDGMVLSNNRNIAREFRDYALALEVKERGNKLMFRDGYEVFGKIHQVFDVEQ